MKQLADEKTKLRIENKKLVDEIKKLKFMVLKLQKAMKIKDRNMAVVKHTLSFTEVEFAKAKIKNLLS